MSAFNTLQTFRKIAFAEGVSYLLIFGISMPLKYWMDVLWPNKIIGLAHGVLFILYFVYLFQLFRPMQWKISTVFWLSLASLVPFGTFIADAKILKPSLKQ